MGNQAEEKVLLRVAQAISDGRPVDWEAEQLAHAGLRARLKHLQILEAVATAHEATPGEEKSEPDRAIPTPSTLTAAGTLVPPDPGSGSPASAAPAVLPLAEWGPLAIRERLGGGGFGDVYRAYDPSLQRDVALKLLRPGEGQRDPSAARRLDEARRLARVRHPNVVVVHGVDEHEGRVGIWTDLVRGRTLEQSLTEQGPLGAQEACLIGIDLCGALAAVHAAGLVHRDVKTSNVMREQGGRIVLMDFGSVSERVRGDDWALPETVSGTPLFMAPEHLAGQAATPASDLYSLGVVLYRLVTGRFPVEAASLGELREKHRKGEQVPLRDLRPDLPAGFVRVVERALSGEPGSRHGSAGAMEQALTGALGLAVPEKVIADPEPPPPWRAMLTFAAAAAALAVSAGILYWALRPVPLKADATLIRTNGTEERLSEGGLVHPGDRLVLEISSRESLYVYVLNEDENGEVFVLFPAGLDLTNPLPPGTRHRLPGRQAGEQVAWKITSAGGTEKILVIAARERQPDLESDIAGFRRAAPGQEVAYAPLSQRTVLALRGIGGMAPADDSTEAARGDVLAGIARSLASRAAGREGLWTWQIELQNPGS